MCYLNTCTNDIEIMSIDVSNICLFSFDIILTIFEKIWYHFSKCEMKDGNNNGASEKLKPNPYPLTTAVGSQYNVVLAQTHNLHTY